MLQEMTQFIICLATKMLESIAVRSCKAVNSHIQIWIQNPHIVLSPLENSVPVECYHINYRIHLAATAMSHHLLGAAYSHL